MSRKNYPTSRERRLTGVELLEKRCLLSASPIDVGIVYYEGAPTEAGSGVDTAADYIYVAFQGGAEGTQLSQITIDLARYGQSGRYCFIDQGQYQVPDQEGYGYCDFQILESTAYASSYAISRDGTLLTIDLEGFQAGEVLTIVLDVDEMLNADGDIDAEATGAEMAATSKVSMVFTADGFQNALLDDVAFKDFFETAYPGYDIPGLPNDAFNNEYAPIPPADGAPQPVYTAGAFASSVQVPLPCTISGYVYEDVYKDGKFDQGVDKYLGGVTVQLWALNGSGDYVLRDTTTTDADGRYEFDVEPGTYRIIERTPDGYSDVTSFVGTIDGVPVGTQIDANGLTGIALKGGQDSVRNDFSEYRPATISGHVFYDKNYSGKLDAGDGMLAGVEITLTNVATGEKFRTSTDADGYWEFTGLVPGEYEVSEVTPAGYVDGRDTVGSLGGTQTSDSAELDLFSDIRVVSGDRGVNYDFGEVMYSTIAGKVWVDRDDDGVWDAGEKLLENVRIDLVNAAGNVVGTQYTNASGAYRFTGLLPDTYTVVEHQPTGYINGGQVIGSEGGAVEEVGLRTHEIALEVGVDAVNYDFWEYEYAQISGYVFKDGPDLVLKEGEPLPSDLWTRYPGVRGSNSTPLANVKLVLADANGVPVRDADGKEISTVTDSNGHYRFTRVKPGTYTILEEQPSGYVDGIDTPGSLGGTALAPTGDKLSNIDVNYGDDGVEYNFSEIRVTWDEPDKPGGNPKEYPPPGRAYHTGGGSSPVTPNGYLPYYGSTHGLSLGGGGGGGVSTWHLSILNGGVSTSVLNAANSATAANTLHALDTLLVGNTIFDPNTWEGYAMNRIQWLLNESAGSDQIFGLEGATALAGDFNGDGLDELAIFLDGFWFIDYNGNRVWDDYDLWVQLGSRGDQPVVGDWDGDGKTDIGVFGHPGPYDRELMAHELGLPDAENLLRGKYKNIPQHNKLVGYRYMKATKHGVVQRDVIDHVFQFGTPGDIAVTGDWNGDGVWSIGVFRDGKWTVDYDGDGRFTARDKVYTFGERGDTPVVGKWDGGETSRIGVYRDGVWHLDVQGNGQYATARTVRMGAPGDMPIVGDFDGSGVSEVATYREVAAPEALATAPKAGVRQ